MKGLGNRIFSFLFPRGNRMHRNIFLSVASMVVFVTTYMLILPAITQSTTTYCGLEEHTHTSACYETTKELICGEEESEGHTHTDDCYTTEEVLTCENTDPDHVHDDSCYTEEKVLTCDQEECEGHQHTDACYEETTELVCGMEEHEHDASCYADPDADVEESADWEATMKDLTLTGKWSDDLVTVAKSQLGYKESKANYSVDESGEDKGYTRYGAWYGNAYGDWSAMFASFCLNYAGVDSNYFPEESSCSSWIKKLNTKEYPYYYAVNGQTSVNDPADYAAAAGDLAFLDCDGDGAADHVGILQEVICNDDGSVSQITMIVGDSNDCVENSTCDFNDGQILGFAKLPENPAYVDPDADTDTESQTAEAVSETEETSESEAAAESEETASGKTFSYESEEIAVTAEVSSDAGIPADAEFKVIPVTRETEGYNYDAYMQALNEQASKDAETVSDEESETEAEDNGLAAESAESIPTTYTDENTLLYDIAFLGSEESYDGESSQVEYQPKAGSVKLTVTFKQKQLEEIAPEGEDIVLTHLPLTEEVKAGHDTTSEATDITVEDIKPEEITTNINIGEKEDTAEFSMTGFSVISFTAGTAKVTDGTPEGTAISDGNDFTTATVSGNKIYLTADIEVKNTVTISGNTQIDLNGYSIKSKTETLFQVNDGGTLTIIDTDSQNRLVATEEVVATGTDTPAGNLAVVDGNNLTYYVTNSEANGNGTTTETLYKYTIKGGGRIIGKDNAKYAIKVNGGTVNLNGGYIFNFTADNGGPAVQANGGTVNLNGSVLAGNTTTSGNGGAVSLNNGAVMNMTGGVISGNHNTWAGASDHDEGGGGIYVTGQSTLNLSGGYITNNKLDGTGWRSRGGGVAISRATMKMTGGYVTGNESGWGSGGIGTMYNKGQAEDPDTYLSMTAGFVSANCCGTANDGDNDSEGGGIGLLTGTTAYLKGGYLTNNYCNSHNSWGGGGLFIEEGSEAAFVQSVLIAQNSAGGFGGGVAGCSTGHLYAVTDASIGYAIFDNTAEGTHLSVSKDDGTGSSKNEDHLYAQTSSVFMNSGYQDIYGGHDTVVDGGMIGKGSKGTENWTGSADGKQVSSFDKDDTLTAANVMGLTANPSSTDKENAISVAQLNITGNGAYTHGGGILTNGILLLGKPQDETMPAQMKVIANKYFKDGNDTDLAMTEGEFTFYVTDENGNIVTTGTNDENGKITFDNLLLFKKEGTFTYYVKEADLKNTTKDDGTVVSTDGILKDSTEYRLTVTVDKETLKTLNNEIDGSGGTTSIYQLRVQSLVIDKRSDSSSEWENVDTITGASIYTGGDDQYSSQALRYASYALNDTDHGAKSLFKLTFTNRKPANVTVKVTKNWADGNENHTSDSVTVHLLQNGKVMSGKDKTLSAENGWSDSWEKLPVTGKDESGNEVSYTYTVSEDAVSGYAASISDRLNSEEAESYWVKVTDGENLIAGTDYVFVSADGTNVLTTASWNGNYGTVTKDNSLREITAEHNTSELTVEGTSVSSTDWYDSSAFSNNEIFNCSTYSNHTILTAQKDDGSVHYLRIGNYNSNYFVTPDAGTDSYSKFSNAEGNNQIIWTDSPGYSSQVKLDENGYLMLGVKDIRDMAEDYSETWGYLANMTYNCYYHSGFHITPSYMCRNVDIIEYNPTYLESTYNAGFVAYKRVYVGETKHSYTKDVTITNTPTSDLTYDLNVTKKSTPDSNGKSVVLRGAEFKLLSGETAQTFVKADGYYRAATDEDKTKGLETTDTLLSNENGEILVKGLSEGTYTLRETKAPNGYTVASDQTVTLNSSTPDQSLSVTVEDAPETSSYELPKTGGTGTTLYTMSGCIICLSALGIGFFRRRRRERRSMV